MQIKIVVFDLCGTLYRENTSIGAIHYYLKNSNAPMYRRVFFLILTRKLSPVNLIFRIIHYLKLSDKDYYRSTALWFIKGVAIEEFYTYCVQYIKYLDNKFRIKVVWDRFIREKKRGSRIVICSASFCPILKAFSSIYNVEYLCTSLESDIDVLTGKITQDITNIKYSIIKNQFGSDVQLELCISDNYTDMELIRFANEGYAIANTKRAQKAWKSLGQKDIMCTFYN